MGLGQGKNGGLTSYFGAGSHNDLAVMNGTQSILNLQHAEFHICVDCAGLFQHVCVESCRSGGILIVL